MSVIAPTAPVTSGGIRFGGQDIKDLHGRARRRLSSELQAVFQDPYSSLNPSRTVGQAISEGMAAQGRESRERVAARVAETIRQTGLPADAAARYPAMLSGGQRQRVAIARAVIGGPRLVICDEVTSALDLSVKAQILNLLRDLQASRGLSLLFIGHDLPVVRHISHRIVVLYRGVAVEEGPAEEIYRRPRHPYTQALIASSPVPDPALQRGRRATRGPASASAAESGRDAPHARGCAFAGRCPYAVATCSLAAPPLVPAGAGVQVACTELGRIPVPDAQPAASLSPETPG
jgi:peptide/nickel transport system ATP-binding protein